MIKNNYSQGFLYHRTSQQILLQQKKDERQPVWTLLDSLNNDFQTVVAKLLKIKLKPKAVLPIYDYVVKSEKHFISYAEVGKLKDFPATKTHLFKWFTIKEISKLPLSSQAKQDIIVGRRVIDSQVRKDAGERTIG